MSTRNNGGPAFPMPFSTDEHHEPCNTTIAESGMSLRDYFAAKAMQEIMAATRQEGGLHMGEITEHAYKQADWMLSEREK